MGKTCPQVGEASWPMWESDLSHDTHSQEAGNEQEEEWGYKVSRSSSDSLSLARLPAYEGSQPLGQHHHLKTSGHTPEPMRDILHSNHTNYVLDNFLRFTYSVICQSLYFEF